MVKRILLTSLLLFMPLFAHADVPVIGENVTERNIKFNLDVMEIAFKDAFSDVSNYENIRGNFYNNVYNAPLPMPFSMQDLHEVCQNSVPKLAKKTNLSRCADLVRIYIEEILKYSVENKDAKQANKVDTDKFIRTMREYNEVPTISDATRQIIKDYIANGVDVNVPVYEDGHTPLMIAINRGDDDLVRLLLDANADVNAITKTGKTPLYIAVASENLKVTDLLLKVAADPNVRLGVEMMPTVLFVALEVEAIDIIELLLSVTADRNVYNIKHETPCDVLHHTKQNWEHFNRAKLLLCENAESTHTDSISESTTQVKKVKTCLEKDPDDLDFTACCIAEEEGAARWNPYTRVCSCVDAAKAWNAVNGTCDYKANLSCEEKYPGNIEAVYCCKAGEKFAFWNEMTNECKCLSFNRVWDSNTKECVYTKH